MFRRGRYGPAGYITYGAGATMGLLGATHVLARGLGIGWGLFSGFGAQGLIPSFLLGAAIGAACSAAVWLFTIRPLRPNIRDLASTFD